MSHVPETRASLFSRLPSTGDAEAWAEFTSIYEPFVYRFARRGGLQDADVRELVQEVRDTLLAEGRTETINRGMDSSVVVSMKNQTTMTLGPNAHLFRSIFRGRPAIRRCWGGLVATRMSDPYGPDQVANEHSNIFSVEFK